MDTTLILLFILTGAFAVAHLESRLLGERVSFFTDAEYLIVGGLCGPYVFGLLTPERMASLEPLLAAVTGFIGFMVGMHLRFRRRHANGTMVADRLFAVLTCTATALVLAGAGWGLLVWLTDASPRDPLLLLAAATLGFGGVVISSQAVRVAILRTRSEGPVTQLLRTTAITGQVLAIVGFGLTIASRRALDTGGHLGDLIDALWLRVVMWNVISVVAGVATGLIFHLFVGEDRGRDRLFLGTVGLVALTAGVAEAMDFSTVFLGLTAGLTICFVSPVARHVAGAVNRLTRPTHVILLVLAGALWVPIEGRLWLVPAAYIVLRLVMLRAAARLAAAAHPRLDSEHRAVGSGLLAQGALAAAIAVNVITEGGRDNAYADVVVTTLLISAVANELWGSLAVRRLLQNSGETGRAPEWGGDGEASRVGPLPTGEAAQ